MALDPSIILGVRPAQPDNPLDTYAKSANIASAIQGNQLRQLKLDEARRGVEQQSKLRQLLEGADPNNPDATYGAILRSGALKEAGEFQKQNIENNKAKAETKHKLAESEKLQIESAYVKASHLSSILENANPTNYSQIRQQLMSDPIYSTSAANLPEQFDPVAMQTLISNGLTIKDKLAQKLKEAELAQTKVRDSETGRHNVATEGLTARGQNMVDARQREGLALQRDAARQQVVDTDQGPVLVDKGNKTVSTLSTPDGKPLGKPLKDIPASVNTAIIGNNQSLNRAKDALKLLEGQAVGEGKGDKNATGWKGYLPNTVLNRMDPTGVDTRAAISDLGSMVLHDRSGAAVTAAESPRLMPFIPLATDDAATAAKKLKRFIKVYEEEQAAMGATYSKDQGYKPSPVITTNDGWSIKPKN